MSLFWPKDVQANLDFYNEKKKKIKNPCKYQKLPKSKQDYSNLTVWKLYLHNWGLSVHVYYHHHHQTVFCPTFWLIVLVKRPHMRLLKTSIIMKFQKKASLTLSLEMNFNGIFMEQSYINGVYTLSTIRTTTQKFIGIWKPKIDKGRYNTQNIICDMYFMYLRTIFSQKCFVHKYPLMEFI